ncbi:hypothetical protein SODALDRAFT_329852 [Sodiomyces alkalinus F11]|uniref:Uncharacterized protein n=1 Tax=Sodiomyces alkalinus (strain CBS 110278 / VKM F-3762 / F11) TaxID=1314773 RepID=A0A3N2Q086_SODAK|nr:hypothetical protein SODALDRAFT_329852 [Sodiomyces alkalinus F11]ROT40177.1 hypothetical protein SODALDRAFT_329852 [Sodiomyces alkalinus F11]
MPVAIQRRSVSQAQASTEQQQNPHVIFDAEVNPNLAPVLTEIQNKIVLPSYLPRHQRQRVFNPKFRHSLKTNPVIIEIDGLAHRFEHIPLEARPSTRACVYSALQKMETARDWSNFIRLFAGLRRAHIHLSTPNWVKIIRQVGTKRHIYAIIDAARQIRRTGLALDVPAKLHEVLFFAQLKALEAGWAKEELEQALRWSVIVLDMVADPRHEMAESRRPAWLVWPLARDPLALAAPLHLAAALAVGHHGGQDVDGQVAAWAKQVVGVWPEGKGVVALYPEAAYEDAKNGGVGFLKVGGDYVAKVAMVLHGLKLATQVVEPALAEKLQGIVRAVEPELAGRLEQMAELHGDGLPAQVYSKQFDSTGALKLEVSVAPSKEGGETASEA